MAGKGIGRDLLSYIKQETIEQTRSGCRYITVDAYTISVEFYSKNGFVFLTEEDKGKSTRLMYFDLKPLL